MSKSNSRSVILKIQNKNICLKYNLIQYYDKNILFRLNDKKSSVFQLNILINVSNCLS